MGEPLPQFQYHPDPIASGVVVASGQICVCCEHARGYVYTGPAYALVELSGRICPWCIYNGAAAKRFDAIFNDDHPLLRAGLSGSLVSEVAERTPGYVAWQQGSWLIHCNQPCVFRGDASVADVRFASEVTMSMWAEEYGHDHATWLEITRAYEPGGEQAFYTFECNQCGVVLLGWDCA